MELEEYLVRMEDPVFVAKIQHEIGDAVAVATTTFYPDPNIPILADRARLTGWMIKEAVNKYGYKVFVVDGGSHIDFVHEFENSGAVVIEEEEHARGVLGPGRRQAIRAAYDSRPINVWKEPEKHPYVKEIVKTAYPIAEGFADIVVPGRKSLSSYPEYQQNSEKRGNEHWEKVTGLPLDVWLGPKTFRGRLGWGFDAAIYFLVYDGHSKDGKEFYGDKWDATFLPIIDAYMAGAVCIGVPVDYTHPASQTKFEEGNAEYDKKRDIQLANLMSAISNRWKEYQK